MRAGLNSRQQRLRLGDLGHLGSGREAFQRGRENGLGDVVAVGRLIELGEGKRRAQTPTACALLACDGNRGSESFLRGAEIGLISAE
jgi:hypothetical protein